MDGGGGGDLRLHSREEAVREIESVWKLLITTRPDNPIQVAAEYLEWKDYAANASWNRGKPLTKEETGCLKILKRMLGENLNHPVEMVFGRYEDTDLSRNLKNKKLSLIESGQCRGPNHKGHIAAVSQLNFSADVCVSISEVRKIPFAGVTSTPLIALLVHEIVHLHGYSEPEAVLVHEFFLRQMKTIISFRSDVQKKEIAQKAERTARLYKLTAPLSGLVDAAYIGNLSVMASKYQALMETIPRPYGLETLSSNDPDSFEKIYRTLSGISETYQQVADELTRDLAKIGMPKLSATNKAKLSEAGVAGVRVLKLINIYLFGSESPLELAAHELDTEEFPLTEKEVTDLFNR